MSETERLPKAPDAHQGHEHVGAESSSVAQIVNKFRPLLNFAAGMRTHHPLEFYKGRLSPVPRKGSDS
ncbi:MAG: hypothetical protein PHX87_03800 [Candidatus Peribacteraceae bacterium]|nr:hypothetical protein [Candidatus Peribacteraceae bacterium]MDD5742528.1 hypothetical protein [Candidatus Peribacteraceae bacterium]